MITYHALNTHQSTQAIDSILSITGCQLKETPLLLAEPTVTSTAFKILCVNSTNGGLKVQHSYNIFHSPQSKYLCTVLH